jgi:hypothetical protein
MGKPDLSPEVVEEAASSVIVLLEAMRERIADLKMIWRRQRMEVDTQIRYYANGLLEDYYRVSEMLSHLSGTVLKVLLICCQKYRKEEFDTDLETFEESEWGSEDEWDSEDGGEGVHGADNTNTSSAAESSE